ncbi:MAG: hypothetical protein AB2A00_37360 [Myxococcota bacterium]
MVWDGGSAPLADLAEVPQVPPVTVRAWLPGVRAGSIRARAAMESSESSLALDSAAADVDGGTLATVTVLESRVSGPAVVRWERSVGGGQPELVAAAPLTLQLPPAPDAGPTKAKVTGKTRKKRRR